LLISDIGKEGKRPKRRRVLCRVSPYGSCSLVFALV